MIPPISIIITTYNWPQALALVLQGLAAQTQKIFEVVIADDGSTADTRSLLDKLRPQLSFPLHHVWQEDCGFRAAKARNQAIAKSTGDYLIFMDGDCIPPTDFVARHSDLAETHCFVTGNRVLLNEKFTLQVIEQQLPLWAWSRSRWLQHYCFGHINRLLPLLRLPDNSLRNHTQKWQGAKTCNLGLWRRDMLAANGFDESFQGWGHEDADLVVRLLRSGIKRKDGRFAVPVLHLWHPEQDRSQEPLNQERLQTSLQTNTTAVKCGGGLDQYLA